ncbi:MAG: PilT/PilU family type 4a pilus ATPase [Oceanospirillaceae bacterium]
MTLAQLLAEIIEKKASDLFLVVGAKANIRVSGKLLPISEEPLSVEEVSSLVFSSMNARQKLEFENTQECNFAVGIEQGRFRVSAYFQRGTPAMVVRRIHTQIPTMESLQLPNILKELALSKRGLILFVGATGTGKTTSLASLIDYRNANSAGHIITIEDPIEYLHEHKKSIITQREISIDTESFENALQNSLRQSPDVILMGEIRNLDVMRFGLTFAETGQLCLATLHANNADQALNRIINMFPVEYHVKLRLELSVNLKAIVAQQLVPAKNGNERRVATEILTNTPLVSELISKGRFSEIKDVMKKSNNLGMQTFDQSLYKLYLHGEISYESALSHADSANDLRLMIKLSADTQLDTAVTDYQFSLQD